MAALLANLTELKSLMGWAGSACDSIGAAMLLRASAIAEQLARRPLCRQAGRVEFPNNAPINVERLRLQLYPIEVITSVRQLYVPSTDAQFTAETALTEITDYVIEAAAGNLVRVDARWYQYPRCIRVEYTGGYYDPSSAAPSASAIAPPENLKSAVLQQAAKLFQQKDSPGLSNVSLGEHGGSASFADRAAHPELVAVCKVLRRLAQ